MPVWQLFPERRIAQPAADGAGIRGLMSLDCAVYLSRFHVTWGETLGFLSVITVSRQTPVDQRAAVEERPPRLRDAAARQILL